MTRMTNFRRKRTYLEAGFHSENLTDTNPAGNSSERDTISERLDGERFEAPDPSIAEPPTKKRRKRAPKRFSGDGFEAAETQDHPTISTTKKDKRSAKNKKLSAPEARRLKRINQRLSETTCFACREKGHAAKDCPEAQNGGAGAKKSRGTSKPSIGICYRCGSETHTLSRCKKPIDPTNPFPFASCFVCSTLGHLASSCPQNGGKGIYPNGGCCKLCGETTHLARNCTMRQNANDPMLVIGTACEAGADEDDFHTFKRTTIELDRAEKREERVKKMMEVKKGVVSGVMVRAHNAPVASARKKVVVFK